MPREREGRHGRRQPRQHGVHRPTDEERRSRRLGRRARRRIVSVVRRSERALGDDGVARLVDDWLDVTASVLSRAVRTTVTRLDLLRQVVETLQSAAHHPTVQHHPIIIIIIIIIRIASEEVVLHLISSKCSPVHLYGLEVCPLSKSNLQSLNYVLNRFLMKLFKTSNNDIISDSQNLLCFSLTSELLVMP